ncbi:transcriptional regulator [Salmonella enterica]|nr:transcriptional regulator [Salmonella enterica]ELI0025975.1 transcriptional regulator [Salmonella enterica]ELI0151772.1 transcriptional regulator [Salmonella enterica]
MQTIYPEKSECDDFNSCSTHIPGVLIPGKIDICHFRLLMTVSMIKKKNLQKALEDVLVRGHKRREVCERYGVSQSYFSVKYNQLQLISQTAVRIYSLIENKNFIKE